MYTWLNETQRLALGTDGAAKSTEMGFVNGVKVIIDGGEVTEAANLVQQQQSSETLPRGRHLAARAPSTESLGEYC